MDSPDPSNMMANKNQTTQNPSNDLSSSEVKHNIYFSNLTENIFEEFSNKNYLLIDFLSKMKTDNVIKLMGYFENKEAQGTDPVLCGYVTGVLTKILEVSSGETLQFFGNNWQLLNNLINHLDNFSVSQFLLNLLSDNFVIREKKKSFRDEETIRTSSLEITYSSIYDSRSRNALFRDSSENVFDFQMKNFKENLESGNVLMLKDILHSEMASYITRVTQAKQLLTKVFERVLKVCNEDHKKAENGASLLYSLGCKVLDLLSEHADGEGMKTYMNKVNR